MPAFSKDFQPETSGRKKGRPNKINTAVKELILQALHEAHPKGAVAYLKMIAQDEPAVFAGLVRACMPREFKAEVESNVNIKTVNVHRLDISGLEVEELDALEGALRKTYMLENQKMIKAAVVADEQAVDAEYAELDADQAEEDGVVH